MAAVMGDPTPEGRFGRFGGRFVQFEESFDRSF